MNKLKRFPLRLSSAVHNVWRCEGCCCSQIQTWPTFSDVWCGLWCGQQAQWKFPMSALKLRNANYAWSSIEGYIDTPNCDLCAVYYRDDVRFVQFILNLKLNVSLQIQQLALRSCTKKINPMQTKGTTFLKWFAKSVRSELLSDKNASSAGFWYISIRITDKNDHLVTYALTKHLEPLKTLNDMYRLIDFVHKFKILITALDLVEYRKNLILLKRP